MDFTLHSLLSSQAKMRPEKIALKHLKEEISYKDLSLLCTQFSSGCRNAGITKSKRVAVYLPKSIETVAAFFGTLASGACLVPINAILKNDQVKHILCDCDVELLVTSLNRLNSLQEMLNKCPNLHQVVLVDVESENVEQSLPNITISSWKAFCTKETYTNNNIIETDLAAIFYTSGSTGKPKGVVLNHRNMRAGAESVASYLKNTSEDRILAVLPFSFDYGFSQLTTSFCVGATVVLLEYLFPKDVIKALESENITGLAAVPPLWLQISQLNLSDTICKNLRYITNSGGVFPQATINSLLEKLPNTDIYLMYGLTEAFRSTYLPPNEIKLRPTSIGKAIPNAEVLVLRADGSECEPEEVGELVHRGPLVAQGYWNDPEKTAHRFKSTSITSRKGVVINEIAVWSGDSVKKDKDGYLYFIGREDEMIKTSGYRVSPSEVEEASNQLTEIDEAVAFGAPHPKLGQAIALIYTSNRDPNEVERKLDQHMRNILPLFMVPTKYIYADSLPRNSNGKFDRKKISSDYQNVFT
jgi:acyl-CoA ligase (AMP-forming) (exosortase A-associated)